MPSRRISSGLWLIFLEKGFPYAAGGWKRLSLSLSLPTVTHLARTKEKGSAPALPKRRANERTLITTEESFLPVLPGAHYFAFIWHLIPASPLRPWRVERRKSENVLEHFWWKKGKERSSRAPLRLAVDDDDDAWKCTNV
ncbi:hypothetical protein TNIN_435281 [Trichonephila inaurata madagascariensis]|uniref:Uncharacterized protein n=1 Tax=Trichonephila inaurata madagascariensis TaxID=2747483 RepID=A0A8X7CCM2_9ARAC|nr:hypothetical protein TNIN_435281 [Trichonephila inaurata madagascariensis]